jgi:hypothetical protein
MAIATRRPGQGNICTPIGDMIINYAISRDYSADVVDVAVLTGIGSNGKTGNEHI